jgi:hypothetical protein
MSAFVDKILDLATAEVGVREVTPNRGPRVDEYHRYAGRDPDTADSWCAQFVGWVIGHAEDEIVDAGGAPQPTLRFSSSVLRMWEKNPAHRVTDPRPGDVFFIDHGKGKGHCGFVVGPGFGDGVLLTIEGNTSVGGSRNGDGVYARSRGLAEINLGFLRPELDDANKNVA